MNRRSLWLLLGAGALTLLVVGSAVANPQATPRRGGTVIYGLDQEPRILNSWLTEGNLFATTEVVVPMNDSGMRYNNRGTLVPLLFAGQPRIISTRPFRVRWSYKQAARWSDGRHVTGDDFVFAINTNNNRNWDITSREGLDQITRVRISGKNRKTVTATFKSAYAGWKPVVATSVLPRHVLRGQNFNQVWRNDHFKPGTTTPIGNGPMRFNNWLRGSSITLVREPRYWGPKAFLDRITYKVVSDTNTQFQAIRSGELSILRPQPQLQIADARRNANLRVQSGPEFAWEHVDIQQGPQGHAALKRLYVRQALIRSINRTAIANALYRTISPGLPVLNSVIFKPFERAYRPHFNRWTFNRAAAETILRNNRCTKGGDGIYTCPQVGRLSFGFVSTAGNQLRELAFEVLQSQWKAAGIEVVSRFGPATTVFGQVLPSGNWDMFMFTWVGSPTSPIFSSDIHGCGGDLNYMNYCNRTVTNLLNRVKTNLNEAQRNNLLNQANARMAADIPQIPLFARPGFLIHERRIQGILRNPTTASALWNANKWWSTAR